MTRAALPWILLLSAALAGCGPAFGANDLQPRGARRVVVPPRRQTEPLPGDPCAWSCELAARPGERLVACRRLHVEQALLQELGTSEAGMLCVFQ
jgi:hypothetical protein